MDSANLENLLPLKISQFTVYHNILSWHSNSLYTHYIILQHAIFNQERAWFLKIDSAWDVGMHVSVCVSAP